MVNASEYLKAIEENYESVLLPSGMTFKIGPMDLPTYFKMQTVGEDLIEFKGKDADDPEVQKRMLDTIKESDIDVIEIVNLVFPAVCKEPCVVAGNRGSDKNRDYLYISDISASDAIVLMDHIKSSLGVDEATSFREEQAGNSSDDGSTKVGM